MTIPTGNMMPRRLAVLKALVAHLQGITPDNSKYDLSQSVFRGKTVFGANAALPMLSILESPKPDQGDFAGYGKGNYIEVWDILLQGFSENDQDNPTDPAYWLAAAVVERLDMLVATTRDRPTYPDVYRLNGCGVQIADILVGPPVVRPPDDQVSSAAYFYLPLRVQFASDNGQPYTPA